MLKKSKRSISYIVVNNKSIFIFIFIFFSNSLFAEVIPSASAGVIDRQIEEQYKAKEISPDKEIPILEIDIPDKKLEIQEGETLFVKDVIFEGNTIFKDNILKKCVLNNINQNLSMNGVLNLCACIKAFYVKKGYFLARTYCPPQEVEKGILKIKILEGNLGDILVINNKKYKTAFIKGYFERFLDKPINYYSLMEALLLVNENLKLEVGSVFKKGKKYGTVDLVLQVKDELPLTIYIDENNYGSLFTSKYRSGAKAEVGNLLTNGDVLTITQVFGNPFNALYFSLYDYKLPLTKRGTLLDFSYLFSLFSVNQLEELNLQGRSDIFSTEITQAIYRTKLLNMDFYSSFDIKQIENFSLGDATSRDDLRNLNLGLSLDYIDSIKGRTYLDFTTCIGIPSFLGGSKAVDPNSSRPGAGARFAIFRLDLIRLQQVVHDQFIYFHLNTQITANKLPLPEQIFIGGMPTIRGYRLANALGDKGYYFNLEYRMPFLFLANNKVPLLKKNWKDFLQIIGFFDNGQVFLTGSSTSNEKNKVSLSSIGFGLRVFGPWKLDFALDVGYPLSHKYEKGAKTYLKISWQAL